MRALQLRASILLAASASALPAAGALSAQGTGGGNVAYSPALYRQLTWRNVGPARGGRVTAVAGIPSEPATFYMGSTGGGVWKTEDYGQTWRNVTDGQIEVGSIGAIDVSRSNPDIVYVGTGSEAIRSNVSTGRGVYKSMDAGKTWKFVGLRDAGQIGAVRIDPKNPDRVFLAVLGHAFAGSDIRGVYRTTDGGANWQRVLFLSDSTGAVDLALDPSNPDVLYAAMWRAQRKPWTIISGSSTEDGIYKSTDGGDHWTHLTKGLPTGLVGKIALSIPDVMPNRVYALVEAVDTARGVYRSDDAGASWRHLNHDFELLHRPWYYDRITADPKNADVLYVNNEPFFESTDGGRTFHRLRTPHGDNHALWINPADPRIMIQSNDGGANVTLNGGRTWSTQYNQPTAELYQVHLDDRFPYRLYAAQQDNTTVMVPSLPPMDYRVDDPVQLWEAVGGCETGPAIPKPGDPDIVYDNCKGRFSVYDRRTGQEREYDVGDVSMYGTPPENLPYRFQRVSPIEVSPFDPNTVYYGSQYLHRTTDEGRHWETISPDLTAHPPGTQGVSGGPITRDITGEEVYSTIYAIEASPLEKGVIWTGSNDGLVYVTRDDGKTWTNVTPKDMPPGGRVQNIGVSPHRPGSAYIAYYRFLLDDFRPFIYRTNDYGSTWTLLTNGRNGIPEDQPTRVVREDPVRPGLLYAGTEMGIYASFDDGARWQPLQLGLPATPVTDLRVKDGDLVISTMGRSFWMLHDIAPLRELTPEVADAAAHLFAPALAYRMRYAQLGNGPADPRYPPPGAAIDYSLGGSAANGPVRIDILDDSGQVVRSFSSEQGAAAAGDAGAAAPSRAASAGGGQGAPSSRARGGPAPGVAAPDPAAGTPRLETGPGAHRVFWDLRLPVPWKTTPGRFGRRGPMALPGSYTVRLTAAGTTQEKPLTVKLDPRVARSGVSQADLVAQYGLATSVRDLLGRAEADLARVKAELRTATGGRRTRLEAARARLETAPGSYPQPMLVDQIAYLYGILDRADYRPGQDAYTRYQELAKQLGAVEAAVGS